MTIIAIKVTLKLRDVFGNNKLFERALNELSACREAQREES